MITHISKFRDKPHKWFYKEAMLVLMLSLGLSSNAHALRYIITTVAGNGNAGYSGDGGSAMSAQLNVPRNVAVDSAGNLYIVERDNHRVRKITTNGIITTVVGSGQVPTDPVNDDIGDGGLATNAKLNTPMSVTLDSQGNLYIADLLNQRIRKVIVANGIITTVAGMGEAGYSGDGGLATQARLSGPSDVEVDNLGNIYIADRDNQRIRKVNTNGIITTIAGNGIQGYSNGPATSSSLNVPVDLELSSELKAGTPGNLYIADASNHCIRTLSTSNNRLYGGELGDCPRAGAYDDEAYLAAFNKPRGIALDSQGNMYIGDSENHLIRKNLKGTIDAVTTIAGKRIGFGAGQAGYGGDGLDGVDALVNRPTGIAVDSAGNVYFADTFNHRVRKLTPQNSQPVANFTANPTYGQAPLTVQLDGRTSTDSDGYIANYQWTSSDGQSTTGSQTTITFNSAGFYTITLVVTDNDGGTAQTSMNIQVTNAFPTADFTATPTVGVAPLTVQLNASASNDPDGSIVNYQWSSSDGQSKNGIQTTMVFNTPNTYSITLTVTDNEGATAQKIVSIQVNEEPNLLPIANFTANPTSGEAPLTVNFDASSSYDPDGTITNYQWKYQWFINDNPASIEDTGMTPSWTFTEPNTYHITLTVTDNKGATSVSQEQIIEVSGQEVALIPYSTTASTCGNFDVTIQVQAPYGKTVDTVQADLNFNKDDMEVVQISAGAVFDTTFLNQFDNSTGSINFLAGVLLNPAPTGVFDLMTITFAPKQSFSQTTLAFADSTAVMSGINDILQSANDIVLSATASAGSLKATVKSNMWPFKRHNNAPLRVKVAPGMGLQEIITTPNGQFTLNDAFSPGTHKVYVARTNTLQAEKEINVGNCSTSTITYNLQAGDVIGKNGAPPDNFIDIYDVSTFIFVLKQVMLGQQPVPQLADYNLDGFSNNDDLDPNFITSHFDFSLDGQIALDDRKVFLAGGNLNSGDKSRQKSGKGLREGSQRLDLVPNDLATGDSFDVVVEVNVGAQSIDAADIRLNFDPNLLQVNSLNVGTDFDTPLVNSFDNSTGQISLMVAHFGLESPSGIINLMTINLTVLGEGGEQTLALDTSQTVFVSGFHDVPEAEVETVVENIVPGGDVTPAECQLYAVNDKGLNHSQFFLVDLETELVTPLDEECKGCDIEAMDAHPDTNILYVASGNDTAFAHPPGHLYKLDAQTGLLVPVCSTGFEEVSSLAFDTEGVLWGWAKGDGLFSIDPTTCGVTLELPTDVRIEDLSWDLSGSLLYASIDTELWTYEKATGNIAQACDNLPLETEALEVLPETIVPDGHIVLGMHKDNTLKHWGIFNVQTCQVVFDKEIVIDPYNDVEGIAVPMEACR